MTLISPGTASLIIAAIQAMFAFVLWPTIRNPSAQVPRGTSIPTASGLWAIAAVYVGLGLWVAVVMCVTCAMGWTFVAWRRPVKRPLLMAYIDRDGRLDIKRLEP